MVRRTISSLRALRGDRGGTTLVEFAVAAPVLILLYVGGFTVSDAITCNRKVTVTARTLTDLTTRYPAVTEADVSTILNASAQVMAPYPTSAAVITVSEVQVTDATHAKVIWSRSLNGTPLAQNASIVIPTSMAATSTYMILGQVSYTYKPSVRFSNTGNIALSDSILMLPRVSDQVPIS